MRALVVHAHHEPRSFCSALFRETVQTLTDLGHDVVTSNLYADGFDPVSDRRNFTSTDDATYLKQQREERHATEVNGFAPELEREIRKLESCDLLIFSFPIWWFAMPAILKGWVDRAFPMRRIYGDGKLYENGLGKAHKRAMILMTVGGGPDAYGGYGVNPSLNSILAPIQHGVFWFNGFLPLDPFIAWGPARISPEERAGYLQQLRERLRGLDQEMTWRLPHLSDFPGFGKDHKKRFMATLSYHACGDGRREMLAPADLQKIEELMRSGVVLSSHFTSPLAEHWRGFIVLRESDAEKALQRLKELPITSHCDINLSELAQI